MRTYVLVFDDYADALRALRRLRRRGAQLRACVVVVSVDHWNKVKDFLSQQSSKSLRSIVVLL